MAEPFGLAGTEAASERFWELDRWPLSRTLAELVDGNRRAVEAVERALPQLEAAAEAIVERLAGGGRLLYAGAGTSGRLALQDAAELPPTFGFDRTVVLLAGGVDAGARAREGAEDDIGSADRAVEEAGVGEPDVLIGIAASGRTPYTVAAVRAAAERGAATVGVANNPATPLLAAARYPVCLDTGPEVLAGSTRLSAGTAQKIALNALSTAALVRLGGAYRNLMVGMSPSNAKLRERAVAIVVRATGADPGRARAALEAAGGEIRVAIVILRAGVGAPEAREFLEQHGQRVRHTLEALGVDAG
ncbi:MAG TPA: N-acetylmuramic acid 6-phosphate etherase [Trueperaceae bacterium]